MRKTAGRISLSGLLHPCLFTSTGNIRSTDPPDRLHSRRVPHRLQRLTRRWKRVSRRNASRSQRNIWRRPCLPRELHQWWCLLLQPFCCTSCSVLSLPPLYTNMPYSARAQGNFLTEQAKTGPPKQPGFENFQRKLSPAVLPSSWRSIRCNKQAGQTWAQKALSPLCRRRRKWR